MKKSFFKIRERWRGVWGGGEDRRQAWEAGAFVRVYSQHQVLPIIIWQFIHFILQKNVSASVCSWGQARREDPAGDHYKGETSLETFKVRKNLQEEESRLRKEEAELKLAEQAFDNFLQENDRKAMEAQKK